MDSLIVIPSRYGSTRFPGKPLATIAGRTLLERVFAAGTAAAKLAGGAHVLIATDDDRIADHARALGAQVAIVRDEVENGSIRALLAAERSGIDANIIVNLQGDALFTPPETIAALLTAMRAGNVEVATPVVALDWQALDELRAAKKHSPFSGTTCIRAADGRAIWFSKTIVPAIRNEDALRHNQPLSPVWQHIGLYAYAVSTLKRFVELPVGYYERLEGLEQLRLLEAGIPITTIETPPSRFPLSGVDTPADVARAEAAIAAFGDPLGA